MKSGLFIWIFEPIRCEYYCPAIGAPAFHRKIRGSHFLLAAHAEPSAANFLKLAFGLA
jgi:hypothetical protein